MSTKLLLNFKNETYDKLIVSYVGGRPHSQTLTRATLITLMIENQFQNNQIILRSKNSTSYSIKDLFDNGVKVIKKPFKEILDLTSDEMFCNRLNDLNINISYDNIKELSDTILEKDSYLNSILNPNDIDALKDIILPEAPYEYDDGYQKIILLDNAKEYWVFEEVHALIKRYNEIQLETKYFSTLNNFILEQYKKLELDKLFKFSNDPLVDYDNTAAVEFINLFFDKLEKHYGYINKINPLSNIDLSSEFSDEDFKFFSSISVDLISRSYVKSFYNYHPKKDVFFFIKNDLEKILLNSFSVDIMRFSKDNRTLNSIYYYEKLFINSLVENYPALDSKTNIYIHSI